MSEEQQELFDVLEIDGPPYQFTTVEGNNFYPLETVDVEKIKVITFQIDDVNYDQVTFRRNDGDISAGYGLWYTIVSNMIYLNYPGTMPEGRNVYIYADNEPADITVAGLGGEPDTPKKFQEILKLGTLVRICSARKDAGMKNNFEADREQKIADIMWNSKMNEPEWVSPADTMPHAGGRWRYGPVAIITQTGG